jgi:hypothetical protein
MLPIPAGGRSCIRHGGFGDIEHIGSAHDDVEPELLKAVARQRIAAGREQPDLGMGTAERQAPGSGGVVALPMTSWEMGRHLGDGLSGGY